MKAKVYNCIKRETVKLKQPSLYITRGISQMQLDLFHNSYTEMIDKNGYTYEYSDVNDPTFLQGQNEPIHRWFRLTPSYSPEVVKYLFKEIDCNEETLILDPFLGKGTTTIETKTFGYKSIGVEINPILKNVSEYALTWEVDLSEFQRFIKDFLENVRTEFKKFKDNNIDDVVKVYPVEIPKIYNVYRWWNADVLKHLLIIKGLLSKVDNINYYRLIWIAICSSALDTANVHRNHPTISFDDNHNREIDVYKDFSEKIHEIYHDLKNKQWKKNGPKPNIILGDSKSLSKLLNTNVDRVITSPPYPNRFSYVQTTRPQLFFMGIYDNSKQSTELDMESIGGTWGKATSDLQNITLRPSNEISNFLEDFIKKLRPRHELLCNYAIKYFNDMNTHINELSKIANPGFLGAYVVGNSRLSGVDIYTDVLLGKIFEIYGFNVRKIILLRKRGGKRKLYETALIVEK
jgi:hypothetical protein